MASDRECGECTTAGSEGRPVGSYAIAMRGLRDAVDLAKKHCLVECLFWREGMAAAETDADAAKEIRDHLLACARLHAKRVVMAIAEGGELTERVRNETELSAQYGAASSWMEEHVRVLEESKEESKHQTGTKIITTSEFGQSVYDLAYPTVLGYRLTLNGYALRYHASLDDAVLGAREDHASRFHCPLAAVNGSLKERADMAEEAEGMLAVYQFVGVERNRSDVLRLVLECGHSVTVRVLGVR